MLESFVSVAYLAIIITIVFSWLKLRKIFVKKFNIVCTQCGFHGEPKLHTQGSLITEIFLWIFIIPGVFYTFYRLFYKIPVCPNCGNPNLIPANSPVAIKFLKELEISNIDA